MIISEQLDISIIVVAHNVKDLVDECLHHVKESSDTLSKEVIYVDNGSTDKTVELIKEKYPTTQIIKSQTNLGFIGANNLGYDQAKGKYILLLNSDAFLGKETLKNLTSFMECSPNCGVIGSQAVDGKGQFLPSARNFPTPWRLFMMKTGLAGTFPFLKGVNVAGPSPSAPIECDWVTGCCLLVRKQAADSFNFFLRPELFMYNDDNDLCLRVKEKGWQIYLHPDKIVHLCGKNNDQIAKTDSDTSRTERLNIESDYIYFRHNYNLFCVVSHFFLIALFDLLHVAKNGNVGDRLTHIRTAYKLLLSTNFGKYGISNANKK